MANDITYRVSLQDGEVVRRALMRLGKDGQDALQRIERSSAPASRGLLALDKASRALRSEMAPFASSMAAALGVGALVTQVVRINQTFQDLSAGLETATGSAENAARAMDMLREFARETPFELSEVVTAFIRLKNLGLDASADSLRAFGNVASAIPNKTVIDFVEAVADAAVGEFERLKEFGIKAASEGEKVSFTFRGVTEAVGKNADEIQDYLRRLAENNFGGAMARKMETIGGAASNLKDSFDDLFVTIGEMGANDAITSVLKGLTEAVGGAAENLDTITDVAGAAASALAGLMVARMSAGAVALFRVEIAGAVAGLQMMNTFGTAATARMIAMSAATRGAALAAKGLGAALAFVGGPVGATVAALSAGVYLLATRQSEAEEAADMHREALSRFNGIIDTSTGKVKEMAAEVRALRKAQLEAAQAAAQDVVRQQEIYARAGNFRIDRFQFDLAKQMDPGMFGPGDKAVAEAKKVFASARALQQQFLEGKISAAELYTQVSALADQDERLKGLATSMEEWARPLVEAKGNLDEINAALAALDGNATEAQKKMLGIGGGQETKGTGGDSKFDPEKIRKELEKLREEQRQYLDQVDSDYLRATGARIALIEKEKAAKLAQLEKLKIAGEEAARARAQIEVWASSEIAKVREEEAARVKAAEEERLRSSREAADGIKRALTDIRDASTNTAQQWEDDIKGMNQTAKTAFVDIVTGAKSMSDGLQSVLNDLQRRIAGRIYDKAIGGAVDGLLDGMLDGVFGFNHGGGTVGATTFSRRVSPLAFAGAPRFHGGGTVPGLRPGETPIIALRGERVLTQAQQDNTAKTIAGLAAMAASKGPGVNVTVNNNAGQVAQARAQVSQGRDGGMNLEIIVEEIENRISRNVSRGEGMAPTLERRYGLDPAAGARR